MREHLFALRARLFPWWSPSQKARQWLGTAGLVVLMFAFWMTGVVMGSGALSSEPPEGAPSPWRLLAGMCLWFALGLGLMSQMPKRVVQ